MCVFGGEYLHSIRVSKFIIVRYPVYSSWGYEKKNAFVSPLVFSRAQFRQLGAPPKPHFAGSSACPLAGLGWATA